MNKGVRLVLKIAGIAAGVVLAVALALQILLNSSMVKRLVDDAARENLDCELRYSDINASVFGEFPRLRVTLDSVALVYPSDRYSQFDGLSVPNALLRRGRGDGTDTLARFSRITASVNVWPLLAGRIRVCDAGISGLGIFAHSYNDTTANWNVFPVSEEPEDTTSKGINLPWISVGRVFLDGNPEFVYTAQSDTVFAGLSFREFCAGAAVKLSGGGMKIRHAELRLDSLNLQARMPADTACFRLKMLDVKQKRSGKYEVSLDAGALALVDQFGGLDVPLRLASRLGVDIAPGLVSFDVDYLRGNVAHIPFGLEGAARMYSDSTWVDASVQIDDCALDTLLNEYAVAFTESAADVATDARLSFEAKAKGILSGSTWPSVSARLSLPACSVDYFPLGVNAALALDAGVRVTADKKVSAVIDHLDASGAGAALFISGKGQNLLSDPSVSVDAKASACLDSLMRVLPEDFGVEASGNLSLDLSGSALLSEFKDFHFDSSNIKGYLAGDRIVARMPSDSLDASLFHPTVSIGSSAGSMLADVLADSLFVRIGSNLLARVRTMRNEGRIVKVESRGRMTPRLEFSNSEDRVFLMSGANRVFLKGIAIEAAVQKRVEMNSERRKLFLDSLKRVYPGVPRSELFAHMMRDRGLSLPVPSYLSGRDLSGTNLSVPVDSSLRKYLRQWDPEGHIKVEKGGVASPALPLRTRLMALEAGFDNRRVCLDTLGLRLGSSDIGATGNVRGVMGVLRGRRGSGLTAELNVDSDRINANEILAALEMGKANLADSSLVSGVSEEDESFVVDSINTSVTKTDGLGFIAVPGNVRAVANVRSRHVDYSDLVIEPFTTTLNVRDRCLQMTNTLVASNLGDVNLDAYYSTPSRKDISAGVNLSLNKVSADGIIHLLPIVDSLMPALKSFKGDLSLQLAATTELDSSMNVKMPSLEGVMRIKGENLKVEDAGSLRKVTKLLLFRNRNIGEIQNLYVDAIVHDNKAEVFPFMLGVDRYTLALQGMQGFDNTMDYHVSILKSPFLVKFGIDMYGTMDNWRLALTRAKYRRGVPVFTTQLDSMQLNISTYIKDVYKKEAREVLAKSRSRFKDGIKGMREGDVPEGSMTEEEFIKVDSLAFESQMEDEEQAMMSEIDNLLEDAYSRTDALAAEYAKLSGGLTKQKKIALLKTKSDERKKKR